MEGGSLARFWRAARLKLDRSGKVYLWITPILTFFGGRVYAFGASALVSSAFRTIITLISAWGESGAPAGDRTRTPGMGTRLQTAPVCQFQHWGI